VLDESLTNCVRDMERPELTNSFFVHNTMTPLPSYGFCRYPRAESTQFSTHESQRNEDNVSVYQRIMSSFLVFCFFFFSLFLATLSNFIELWLVLETHDFTDYRLIS
jgi:hypothetical protein